MATVYKDAELVPGKIEMVTAWIQQQRWYAGKGHEPTLHRVGGFRFEDPDGEVGMETLLLADTAASPSVVYQVPLTYRPAPLEGGDDALLGTMEHSVLGRRWVYDAPHDPVYAALLVATILTSGRSDAAQASSGSNALAQGTSTGHASGAVSSSSVLQGEQSNTSIICRMVDAEGQAAEPLIVKVFRTLQPGENPDVVVQSALTRAGSDRVPTALGDLAGSWDGPEGETGAQRGHLAFAQEFIPGVEDAWRVALVAAASGLDFTARARDLGVVTAEIHAALAASLGTEDATSETRTRLVASMRDRYAAAVAAVPALSAHAPDVNGLIDIVMHADLPALQRVHGDYHLGQVLDVPERGWVALDFEGEPLRPLSERVLPDLTQRDVAGMLRSFDYAAGSVHLADPGIDASGWALDCRSAFLAGYSDIAGEPDSNSVALTRALELEKALYEVVYEARNRPTWLPIPLAAVDRLLDAERRPAAGPAQGGGALTPAGPGPSLDDGAITAFLQGRNGQPHDLLGHHVGPGGLTITAFRPLASRVSARLDSGDEVELQHVRDGIWSMTSPDFDRTHDYRLLVEYGDGVQHEHDDPYRFAPTLGEIDIHLINEGRHEQLWSVLGSHVRRYRGPLGEVWGTSFALWAPRARAVHVIGDFNGWDRVSHPMRALGASGIWELFLPGAAEGMNYQFAVRGSDDIVRLKTDPMARYTEVAPKQAAIVTESHHTWNDDEWMQRRTRGDAHTGPMSVYEVHIGSWRQGLGYAGLAEHLVNYVRDLGFTHVEFLPVMEHPYVPSWGYHVTGYYAPSSRWGTPDEFRLLVDRLHQAGIGVILDWVPGHFATDEWALARFDGEALYEHPDKRRGWHPEWGSNIFDYGRPEVRNFLVANALYWLEEFHLDGLRVDGVASMLYLDYARNPGEWVPNRHGGRENLEAVELLKETNATAYKRVGGIVTIAEESTSWPGVTRPTSQGGLGFGFKWNMGWMNDSLKYLGQDPIYREHHHGALTFSLMYAFDENFVLPISHDEVVHGKGSLLRKSRGSREEQTATLRAFLAYLWGHPGKQLLFMGCEFGQEAEWSEGRSLDWWLLDQPLHYRVHNLVKDLNTLYRHNRALWELDTDPAGFEWLEADDAAHNTFSWLRFGRGDRGVDAPVVACVMNFSGETQQSYRIGVPRGGRWTVALDTAGYHPDAPSSTGVVIEAQQEAWHHQPWSVEVTVPRLSTVWVVPVEEPGTDASSGATSEPAVDATSEPGIEATGAIAGSETSSATTSSTSSVTTTGERS